MKSATPLSGMQRTCRLLPLVKSKMRWDYDFGDGWEHDIVVEAIEPMSNDATYPVCLAGERACPEERERLIASRLSDMIDGARNGGA